MLSGPPAGGTVQMLVIGYFAGERAEMWTAITAFLAVAAAAAWLFAVSPSAFETALIATILLVGGAMAVGLAVLLVRDHNALPALLRTLDSGDSVAALSTEAARIGVVVSKFRYYRIGAAVLGALALAGLTASNRPWVHGIAVGLLLVVVGQVVIDHFSEQRARIYHAALVNS